MALAEAAVVEEAAAAALEAAEVVVVAAVAEGAAEVVAVAAVGTAVVEAVAIGSQKFLAVCHLTPRSELPKSTAWSELLQPTARIMLRYCAEARRASVRFSVFPDSTSPTCSMCPPA